MDTSSSSHSKLNEDQCFELIYLTKLYQLVSVIYIFYFIFTRKMKILRNASFTLVRTLKLTKHLQNKKITPLIT